MDIAAPGILVATSGFGESDLIAAVFTEEYGIYRGLVRGGQARRAAAIWQTGNLLETRWVARLADQLGTFTGEIVHASAALAMDDPQALSVLRAACAVAEGALPERVPQPAIFRGLLHLVVQAGAGGALIPELVRWELGVLAELGYGLDLDYCVVSGARENLRFVSPKTGRAVSEDAAGIWKDRLLRLPRFLISDDTPDAADLADALRLTGHFLARSVFALQNKPLPQARGALLPPAARSSAPGLRWGLEAPDPH